MNWPQRLAGMVCLLLLTPRFGWGQQIQFVEQTIDAPLLHSGNYMITGQGFADLNNDDWPDLVVTASDGPDHVYMNVGGSLLPAPGFQQAMASTDRSGGIAFADYDNDGDTDLFVACYGEDRLYRNDDGLGFTEIGAAAGVNWAGRGESAAWGDLNADGWPDLAVAGFPLPDSEQPDPEHPIHHNRLYFNNGFGGFSDVTHLLGDLAPLRRLTFAVTIIDFNNDGRADLLFANDKEQGNLLYRNDGPGCDGWCFTDVSTASGAERPVDGMGISWSDYDHDGDLDLFISGHGEQVLLQSQVAQGMANFIEVSTAAGINYNAVGWGSVFQDFDNDGWEDLFLATFATFGASDRVFGNLGDGSFADVSSGSGASDPFQSIGAAWADVNLDGGIDLLVGDYNDRYHLYTNATASQNNWLQLRLLGNPTLGMDALGSRILLQRSDGEQLLRVIHAGDSIGSGSSLIAHFGLGANQAETVEIIWPNGHRQVIDSPAGNRLHALSYQLPEVFQRDSFEN